MTCKINFDFPCCERFTHLYRMHWSYIFSCPSLIWGFFGCIIIIVHLRITLWWWDGYWKLNGSYLTFIHWKMCKYMSHGFFIFEGKRAHQILSWCNWYGHNQYASLATFFRSFLLHFHDYNVKNHYRFFFDSSSVIFPSIFIGFCLTDRLAFGV